MRSKWLLLIIFLCLSMVSAGCACPGCNCAPPKPKCCDPACPKCLGGMPPLPGAAGSCKHGCPGGGCPGECPCDACVCCYTTTVATWTTETCADTEVTTVTLPITSSSTTFTSEVVTETLSLTFTATQVYVSSTIQTVVVTDDSTRTSTSTISLTKTVTSYVTYETVLYTTRVTSVASGVSIKVTVGPQVTVTDTSKYSVTEALTEGMITTTEVQYTLSRIATIEQTVTQSSQGFVTSVERETVSVTPKVTRRIGPASLTETEEFEVDVTAVQQVSLASPTITALITDAKYSPTIKVTSTPTVTECTRSVTDTVTATRPLVTPTPLPTNAFFDYELCMQERHDAKWCGQQRRKHLKVAEPPVDYFPPL